MPATPKKKKTTKSTLRATRATRATKKTDAKTTQAVRKPRATAQKKSKDVRVKPAPAASTSADLREALRAEEKPIATRATFTPQEEIEKIRESAQRLGIELDEQEALQWLTQMAVQDKSEVTVDTKNFVYGAKVAIMDFSPRDLEYFRRIGKIVAIQDQPGVVETALALSGSAAQSKIQTNPGDADFFQRVNIKAPTRDEAVKILADAMRAKGLATKHGADYQLLSVKFGTHSEAVTRNGKPLKKGAPMTWYPKDLEAGAFEVELDDGSRRAIRWEDGMVEPGWTKLDWVVADTQRGILANASNLLDVTWEAPDGEITPLDGVVDPYFQEVYLDASSVPVFSKLVKEVSEDALVQYVSDLEYEVYKYLVKHPNYGKVAKRSYNVFRLTDRYAEAAYIRELFDEPTTALYRVWSLFDTLRGAATPDSKLDRVALLKQYDKLIEQVVESTEGEKEIRIVRALMQARDDALGLQPMVESLDKAFETPSEDVMGLLNEYFHDLLYGFQPVAVFLEDIRQRKYDS
ncbi:MAG: hypothetical protein HY741_16185 [Chloroflexi bacterium]|nr:hypothetical protein [Chloroflexota bacterium]